MTHPFYPFTGGGGGGSGGIGNGNAILVFGSGNIASNTTTRYLGPGYDTGLAQTSVVQLELPREGTLKNLRIRHNRTLGNGNDVVYTVRKNSVATALSVTLASNASSASNTVDTVDFFAGDLIDIEITKALPIGNGNLDVVSALEFA